MKLGIELSGIPTLDRARGHYLQPELENLGFDVRFIDAVDDVDIRIMLKRDFRRKRKENEFRIFDVSDAILTPPLINSFIKRMYQKIIVNHRNGKFLSECDAIVVACRAQQKVMQKYNNNVYIIPDSSYYHKSFDEAAKPDPLDKLVFVWDGQGHNFHYLETIVANNITFFQKNDVLVKVITDRAGLLNGVDNKKRLQSLGINSEFIEWSVETFMMEVNTAHVGLAVVDLECPHASAKPDNKVINYHGLGLPVIASATMAYNDFSNQLPGCVITCKSDMDWSSAIEYWRGNRKKVIAAGLLGREYVLENYTPSTVAKHWKGVIDDLTNGN